MLLHTINQAALVIATDNSGNSCNVSLRLTDVLRMIWVFRTDSFGRGAWKFLVGVLTSLAGVFILGHPLLASAVFRRNRHRRPDGRQTDFHRIDRVAAGHHPA